MSSQERCEGLLHLAPPRVGLLLPRPVPPGGPLDGVNQGLRLPLPRNQEEPTAGRLADVEHGLRDGVRTPELVEKPAIQILLSKSLLDLSHSALGAQK
jgi:hypothetical protein